MATAWPSIVLAEDDVFTADLRQWVERDAEAAPVVELEAEDLASKDVELFAEAPHFVQE